MLTEQKIESMRRDVQVMSKNDVFFFTFSEETYKAERTEKPNRPHIMNVDGVFYAYTELVPVGFLPKHSGKDLKVIHIVQRGQFPVYIDAFDNSIYESNIEQAVKNSINAVEMDLSYI